MKISHTDEELVEWMLEQAEELLEIKFTGNEDPQSYEMPIEEHERHVLELERAVEGWLSGVWNGSAFEKHAYATDDPQLHALRLAVVRKRTGLKRRQEGDFKTELSGSLAGVILSL